VFIVLRSTIASNADFLDEPLHVNKELRLYSFVSDFVTGYHGLTKLIDTQFPFPLAQMNRTFVFIWVYTLPWVLYHDDIKIPSLILIVFFITYAFVGLECVSIELDDPYGNDPNDFDVLGLARVVFQDIFITIFDADGEEQAKLLRYYFESQTEAVQKVAKVHHRMTSEQAWRMSAPQAVDRDAGDDKSNLLLKASRSVSSLKASGSSQDGSFSNVTDSITPGDSYGSTAVWGSEDMGEFSEPFLPVP